MLLHDFFKHVAALIKPAKDISKTITDKRIALVHAALGVAGEIFEIAELIGMYKSTGTIPKDKLIEELGDLFFYTTDLAAIVGHDPVSFDEKYGTGYAQYNNDSEAFFDLCFAGNMVTDYAKKVFAYNDTEKEVQLPELLHTAFVIITRVAQHYTVYYGLNAGGILQANYEKLKHRYPQGYTDGAAAERADKKIEAPADAEETKPKFKGDPA